jgi:hypothetical protein
VEFHDLLIFNGIDVISLVVVLQIFLIRRFLLVGRQSVVVVLYYEVENHQFEVVVHVMVRIIC